MGPDALDFRDAGGFELVPHRTAPVGAAIEGVVVGRHAGHGAEKYWIVAVPEGLDADRGLALLAASVIAGPLAERPLIDEIVRMHEALKRDLSVGWDRQTGLGAKDYLNRLAEQPPGRIVFVLAVWDFDAGHHEQCRV